MTSMAGISTAADIPDDEGDVRRAAADVLDAQGQEREAADDPDVEQTDGQQHEPELRGDPQGDAARAEAQPGPSHRCARRRRP